MSDVWDYGPADPIENAVLLALANHCNDEGQNCYPGITRIAHMVRRSPRTVMRAIQSLEDTQWIKVRRDFLGPRHNGNAYEVNVEKITKSKHYYLSTRGHKPPVYEDLHMTERHVSGRHVSGRHVTASAFTHDSGDNPPAPPIRSNRHRTNTPPSPLSGGGQVLELPAARIAQFDHTEDAIALVCTELGITNRRVKESMREPLLLWKRRNDASAYDAASAMVSAYRDYIGDPRRVGKPMPLTTFFTQGHWLDPASWQFLAIDDLQRRRNF